MRRVWGGTKQQITNETLSGITKRILRVPGEDLREQGDMKGGLYVTERFLTSNDEYLCASGYICLAGSFCGVIRTITYRSSSSGLLVSGKATQQAIG